MIADNTVVVVDVSELWHAVAYHMIETETNALKISAKLGFTPMVMTKLKQCSAGRPSVAGYQPSSQVFLTLCWWMKRDPRDFQRVARPLPVSAPPASDDLGTAGPS